MTRKEAAKLLIQSRVTEQYEDLCYYIEGYNEANSMAIAALREQDAPAADVVERKRGEWVDTGFENSTGKIYLCSACNKANNPNKKDVEMGRVKEMPDFCPNCGADMRGDSA